MSGHKAIDRSSHDHDTNMEEVLRRLGRLDTNLPETWSGSFMQFANLLSVSEQDLNEAFGCEACTKNNRSRAWRDDISWGSYTSEPAKAPKTPKAPYVRQVQIRQVDANGNELFVHYGPGRGIRDELSSRGKQLPDGFKGNGREMAAVMGRSVDDLSRQFGVSVEAFEESRFDVGLTDLPKAGE